MKVMIINMVFAFFFGWLALLTFLILKLKNHYSRLTQRTGKHSIDIILDSLLKEAELGRLSQERVEKKVSEIQAGGKFVMKKIGLIHFHALGKTDGEKSFVISLLNDLNTGVVINFIYIPDGVRVFAKRIKDGKGADHILTPEEEEAIAKAE